MAAKRRAKRGSTRVRHSFPDLGVLDVCLDVRSFKRSYEFYRTLGFRVVEGQREKGWSVLARGNTRIGIYDNAIKENVLNFRGGDVHKIVASLKANGLRPYKVKLLEREGTGNALVKDPDGNVIFFDTTPAERGRRKAALRRR